MNILISIAKAGRRVKYGEIQKLKVLNKTVTMLNIDISVSCLLFDKKEFQFFEKNGE